MSLFSIILKLILRGGYKATQIILITSLFLSIPLSSGLLISGYITDAGRLLGRQSVIAYSYTLYPQEEYIIINYSTIIVNDKVIILISKPEDDLRWLNLHGVRVEWVGDGDVYVGIDAYQYIDEIRDIYPELGRMDVGAILYSNDYIRYSLVVPGDLLEGVDLRWRYVYEGINGDMSIPVPSLALAPQYIKSVASNIVYWFSILLFILLILGLPIMIYISIGSSSDFKKLIVNLYSESGRDIALISLFLASIISIISLITGLSIGLILSHLFSFTVSRVFGTPFIRPELFTGLSELLIIFTITSFLSIFISSYLTARGVARFE